MSWRSKASNNDAPAAPLLQIPFGALHAGAEPDCQRTPVNSAAEARTKFVTQPVPEYSAHDAQCEAGPHVQYASADKRSPCNDNRAPRNERPDERDSLAKRCDEHGGVGKGRVIGEVSEQRLHPGCSAILQQAEAETGLRCAVGRRPG